MYVAVQVFLKCHGRRICEQSTVTPEIMPTLAGRDECNGWPRDTVNLKHMADVRRSSRIGEHRRLQIFGREPVPNGQREDIDHLVDMRSK